MGAGAGEFKDLVKPPRARRLHSTDMAMVSPSSNPFHSAKLLGPPDLDQDHGLASGKRKEPLQAVLQFTQNFFSCTGPDKMNPGQSFESPQTAPTDVSSDEGGIEFDESETLRRDYEFVRA